MKCLCLGCGQRNLIKKVIFSHQPCQINCKSTINSEYFLQKRSGKILTSYRALNFRLAQLFNRFSYSMYILLLMPVVLKFYSHQLNLMKFWLQLICGEIYESKETESVFNHKFRSLVQTKQVLVYSPQQTCYYQSAIIGLLQTVGKLSRSLTHRHSVIYRPTLGERERSLHFH